MPDWVNQKASAMEHGEPFIHTCLPLLMVPSISISMIGYVSRELRLLVATMVCGRFSLSWRQPMKRSNIGT